MVLVVKTIQLIAPCPKCNQPSSRVHSRYERTLTDLPCLGATVQIQLLTRRFFCTNKTCLRRIFDERLPRVVAAYGRQTVRLNDALHLIGMMLGGQAGVKLNLRLSPAYKPVFKKRHSPALIISTNKLEASDATTFLRLLSR